MAVRSLLSILIFVLIAVPVDAKSIFYKVTSSKSTVYILGSIHLAKAELYPLDSSIEKAYALSDVLVVELDPDSAESIRVIEATMRTKGLYPPQKSLQTELSPQTYKMLTTYMAKVGLSLQPMERMRPWTVMLQLSLLEMMRLGYSPELGIDRHFLTMAKAKGKPVLELETAEQQMALLSREDKRYQELLLRYTLESMHEMEPLLTTMFESWKEGDAKRLESIINSSLVIDPRLNEVYDALITRRNASMTARIVEYLKTGKVYFIVVGAGHVVGDDGIVVQLRARGYDVTQK